MGYDSCVTIEPYRQSIQDDLSTFTSHLAALREMLERSDGRSLVLIDEAGMGQITGLVQVDQRVEVAPPCRASSVRLRERHSPTAFFRAGAFFAVAFLAELFLAEDFLAELFFAEDFLDAGFTGCSSSA